ncbi:MAG: hypothetical protein HKN53_10185, partial [Maribacter sp.]|nr:hypothetical protein [Maribacter sp.]
MKKALVIFFIIISLLTLGLFLSAEIFEDKIGDAFKRTVNASITSEFHFEAFDLSMVRSFPYAAIRFNDLSILDNKSDTLLYAGRALFKLDMLSIFQSQIQLHSVEVMDGFINIAVDKKGNRNFEISKPNQSEESRDLGISQASIKNMQVVFDNENSKSRAELIAEDVVLQLDIEEHIRSNILGSIKSNKIQVGKDIYLNDKQLSINSDISYDLEQNELKLADGEVGIEGILFYTNGKIAFKGDHEYYDLVINNTNGSLEEIFKLLPENQVEEFKKISSSGDFDLTVFYKGKQSKYSNPELQADLSFERGRVVVPQLDIPLKAVSFSAKYLDKYRKGLSDASVQINGFKATMDGEKITGKFS